MTTNRKMMRVPIVRGLQAGRGVPDDLTDWEIVGFREVAAVEGAGPNDQFFLAEVDGPSLEHEHILPGDFLLCRVTRDYEIGRIGVWQTPHGRTAKYAYYDPEGFLVLHNDNGWRQEWQASEVHLLGLAVRVERDLPAKWL
jgi:SOS-response transcriptional repressor LexA